MEKPNIMKFIAPIVAIIIVIVVIFIVFRPTKQSVTPVSKPTVETQKPPADNKPFKE